MSEMHGPRPFRPDELRDGGQPEPSATESAALLRTGRMLEGVAASESPAPTADFNDRVFAAIEAEPMPVRPLGGPAWQGSAARAGAGAGAVTGARTSGGAGGFGLTLRRAWSTVSTPSIPFALRAQAAGLLLAVGMGGAAVTAGAAAGAVNVINAIENAPRPAPTLVLVPTPSPAPSATEPSESPDGSESPGESESPGASESPNASGSPDDHGGASGGGSGSTAAPSSTDDHGGSGGSGGSGSPAPTSQPTPGPTQTPQPTSTPEPSASPSGTPHG